MADQAVPAPPQTTPPVRHAPGESTKRRLLSKANSTTVTITAVAAFVIVFCLVSSKTLLSQAMYQNRVASAKKQTVATLKSDIAATHNLVASYRAFDGAAQNIIGGSNTGNGSNDGSNSKIVLDALPSSYDFPALATSLEKIITGRGLTIQGITGTDDEIAQQDNQGSASPKPVPMPFSIEVSGKYDDIQKLVTDLQNSIRPFQIQTVIVSGSQDNMNLTLTAQTFYQPEKDLSITTKVVR